VANRVHVDSAAYLESIRTPVLKLMRREGNRVRRYVRVDAPQRSGRLKARLKVKVGWDRSGPYARVSTWARDPATGFRYGLALQMKRQYLERGLNRTPRR
jgi:hypothetical protein